MRAPPFLRLQWLPFAAMLLFLAMPRLGHAADVQRIWPPESWGEVAATRFEKAWISPTAFLPKQHTLVVEAEEFLLWGIGYSILDDLTVQLKFVPPFFLASPDSPGAPKMVGVNVRWRAWRGEQWHVAGYAGYHYLALLEQSFHETRFVGIGSWAFPRIGTLVSGSLGLQGVVINGAYQAGMLGQFSVAQRLVPEVYALVEFLGNVAPGSIGGDQVTGPGMLGAFKGLGMWAGVRLLVGDLSADLGVFTGLSGDFGNVALGSSALFWMNLQYQVDVMGGV